IILKQEKPSHPLTYQKLKRDQNDVTISGQILDEKNTPLPNVSIIVKDKSSIGTSTDFNGKFILDVPIGSDVVFSIIEYEKQELHINKQQELDLVMIESTAEVDEVVVVGFGQQKKTEMVGAATSIKPSDLKIPSSNLTTALAGRAAGIIAYQRTGEPGEDNADFFIRGVTTFGYKVDPLILIDNVEVTTTDLARLQVDD